MENEAERVLLNKRVRSDLMLLLPASAVEQFTNQVGTYLGRDLSDVVGFALLSWLHDNANRLPRD